MVLFFELQTFSEYLFFLLNLIQYAQVPRDLHIYHSDLNQNLKKKLLKIFKNSQLEKTIKREAEEHKHIEKERRGERNRGKEKEM